MKKAFISSLVIAGLILILAHESTATTSTQAIAGTTWHVTQVIDNGSAGTPGSVGTLTYALSQAQSGDAVVFDFTERMDVNTALVVPAGVSVGAARNQACVADYHNARLNIYVNAKLNPAVSLGAGATLRNVNFLHNTSAGNVTLRVIGADVDVCGVGMGIGYDGDGNTLTQAPSAAAIIVDAPNANIHRNDINGAVIVTENGSGTHIGDDLTGSSQANRGYCGNQGKCAVSLLKSTTKAARNVIVRDPFPRALSGIVGTGTLGGDDVISHTNHWAQAPVIVSAVSTDNFASVTVHGTANPNSLVDLFFDDGVVSMSRQTPVTADASGAFTFTGALPGSNISVIAISTLNDSAQAGHIGSTSQWSGAAQVVAGGGSGATPTATQTAATTQTSTPTSTSDASTSTATATSTAATATVTPTPMVTPTPTRTPTTTDASSTQTPTPTGTQTITLSPTPGEPEIELEHEAWDAIVPYSTTKALEESVPITFPASYENTPWTTSVTTTDGLNWLSATSGGTGNGVLVIHIDPAGLPPGVYQGSIGINPAKARQRAMVLRSASLAVSFSVFMVNHHLYLPVILR